MIPDDLVGEYLATLFGRSEPGDRLHHLLLATAEPDGHTALGLPDPARHRVTFYAIAPDGGDEDAELFVAKTITAAVVHAREAGATAYFAGLAMEVHAVVDDGNEVTENLARRLHADRKLAEHPSVCEMTWLYAACRDGRRWTGQHYLAGPKAGTICGPTLRTGALTPQEAGTHQWLIRLAVGMER